MPGCRPTPEPMPDPTPQSFSERDFYLREFRGRTLAVVAEREDDLRDASVAETLAMLRENGGRAILVGSSRAALERHAPCVTPADDPRLEGDLWRALAKTPIQAVALDATAFAAQVRALMTRLRLFKVVWLDPAGGLRSQQGRHSFVHLDELRGWLANEGRDLATAERLPLWREVDALLEAGVPAVNVCSAAGLTDELFTYSGSGTLFTRERYVTVRRLGVDDYDGAHDLCRRGVEEGYLAPRSDEEIDRVLASAFGAFVEDRDLAGIGALLRWGELGEISSLYTLTRFLGEGVGQHLVGFALDLARREGLRAVFACTTSSRVGAFFETLGFRAAEPAELPDEKWQHYDSSRREAVRCFLHDLA